MNISMSGFDSLGDDLKDALSKIVNDDVPSVTYEVECPRCRAKISVEPGNATCPVCGESFSFTINS